MTMPEGFDETLAVVKRLRTLANKAKAQRPQRAAHIEATTLEAMRAVWRVYDLDLPGEAATPPTAPVWSPEPVCWGVSRVCRLPGWRLYASKVDGRNRPWVPSLCGVDDRGDRDARRVLLPACATEDEAKTAALRAYAEMEERP